MIFSCSGTVVRMLTMIFSCSGTVVRTVTMFSSCGGSSSQTVQILFKAYLAQAPGTRVRVPYPETAGHILAVVAEACIAEARALPEHGNRRGQVLDAAVIVARQRVRQREQRAGDERALEHAVRGCEQQKREALGLEESLLRRQDEREHEAAAHHQCQKNEDIHAAFWVYRKRVYRGKHSGSDNEGTQQRE